MRYLLLAALPFAVTSSFAAEPAPAQQVNNIAMGFVQFWDANKDKPKAEQVAEFKRVVAPAFPGFYDRARHRTEMTEERFDSRIAGAIEDFPTIRTGYIQKAQQFETEMPKYVSTFKARFPDYRPTHDIVVLHSLGEMDGGVRTINGKSYLVFGVDSMVKYHGNGNESAFFHHELFHTHHSAVGGCKSNAVWSGLWSEGLATYVSKVMNPGANNVELLLDFPSGMADRTQAVLPAALAQLEAVLDKEDNQSVGGLFYGSVDDGSGLPRRRGYYLGMLVAQEAAKGRDLNELAKLGCEPVRQIVHKAVRDLRAAQR